MAKIDSSVRNSILTVKSLTKSFGNYRALRGIDINISYGESVAIFGPNGAGKTTLIRVLASTMKPTEGEMVIDGLNYKEKANEIRQRIGLVTHETYLYGNLSVYENLNFYCKLYDLNNARERINEVIAMVAMKSYLHSRVDNLSRGMKQRVAIARSLIHKPVMMLLDEVETGLDQQANSMLWETLLREGEGRRTIIFTTHNLERGLELCDRVIIINKGKIVYEGLKKDLNIECLKRTYESFTRAVT